MKNELHYAFCTTFNFPIQISCYENVKAHLNKEILLISQQPQEWPKLRVRDLKCAEVLNSKVIDGVLVEFILVRGWVHGVFIDRKYFISQDSLEQATPVELLIKPFSEIGSIPMVRREWNPDYMPSLPHFVAHVPTGTAEYKSVEKYHHVRGYEKIGIKNMLDLMAYSYKFEWHPESSDFQLIEDEHVITKRIRKPWMQHMVQFRFGQNPATEADQSKLIAFLLQKAQLSDEERQAIAPMLNRPVELEDLKRMGARAAILNELLEAYNSQKLLRTGDDMETDPFFSLDYE